jgi:hypothetical protein
LAFSVRGGALRGRRIGFGLDGLLLGFVHGKHSVRKSVLMDGF